MIKDDISNYNKNVFEEFGKNWALLTVGGKDNFNTMTVSWGALGVLWNKKVGFIFVRPTRYTAKFMEENEKFTLSFLGDEYKNAMEICGKVSGKNHNKFQETGLTPIYDIDNNLYYVKEAKYVLKFKKLYFEDIDPKKFFDKTIDENNYPLHDYHRMYIGEITQMLKTEE